MRSPVQSSTRSARSRPGSTTVRRAPRLREASPVLRVLGNDDRPVVEVDGLRVGAAGRGRTLRTLDPHETARSAWATCSGDRRSMIAAQIRRYLLPREFGGRARDSGLPPVVTDYARRELGRSARSATSVDGSSARRQRSLAGKVSGPAWAHAQVAQSVAPDLFTPSVCERDLPLSRKIWDGPGRSRTSARRVEDRRTPRPTEIDCHVYQAKCREAVSSQPARSRPISVSLVDPLSDPLWLGGRLNSPGPRPPGRHQKQV